MSMADPVIATDVLGSIEFALAVHLSRHRAEQRTKSIPAYVPGCEECAGLYRAVQQARALAPPAPRRRSA